MQIALVTAAQHAGLVDLLRELHAHYHPDATVTQEAVQAHLHAHLLAPGSPLRLLVASPHAGGEVMGFVAVVLLHSLVDPTPENCRQCLVKELFVRVTCRSQGVGRALMVGAARWAAEQGCGRMDWNVQAANLRGIAFYQSLGAQQVADRLSFRLSAPALRRLATDPDGSEAPLP